ncbi:nitrogen regulatory protein P-II family [Anoxynatronum buryatiense]|uniref:Nitrogen regulatory protein P-II family n=2 Tax=Anoxynatronum buryatiense TaxID=489973 RepID=A0AA46AJ79_9CLOT|nr:nitrogen regulatory protein P-II family [Anoxynatronum buryatiense]
MHPEGCREFELICVIVNFGMGSKIIKHAKQHGVTGGTIFLGKGTIRNTLLAFLELNEVRREIVVMAAEKTTAREAMQQLNDKFRFDKANRGIVFSTGIVSVLGAEMLACDQPNESEGMGDAMHQAIMVIVDRGKAEEVIEAATEAGSRGGTIINARGSGIHETSTLFAMEIEPEKEIVLIISENHQTKAIAATIREKLHIDEPGNGIIFIQNVTQTFGLH